MTSSTNFVAMAFECSKNLNRCDSASEKRDWTSFSPRLTQFTSTTCMKMTYFHYSHISKLLTYEVF